MKYFRRVCVLSVAAFGLCLTGCLHTGESPQAVSDRAESAVERAENAASVVELASDISRRALENGHAAKADAEERLAVAKESGDGGLVASAAAQLKEVSDDLSRSKRHAERVFACGKKVRELTAEVSSLAGDVESRAIDPSARTASRRAARLAGEATRAADEADKSVEFLKRRWLSLPQDPSLI
jgi:hypothetical protein